MTNDEHSILGLVPPAGHEPFVPQNTDVLLNQIRRELGRLGTDSSTLATLMDMLDDQLHHGQPYPAQWQLGRDA